MRIAHLSDLHLFSWGETRLRALATRRVFGAANLVLARRGVHSPEVARAAVAAVAEAGADHCIVTGDLSNLALETEFRLAREVLDPLGGFDRLTVVPGNHDCYTPGAIRTHRFERWFGYTLWRDGGPPAGTWPVVKDLPGVRIVAVRTPANPPPLFSYGQVGPVQSAAVREAVERGRADGRFTVVAFHHNLHVRGLVSETIGRLLDRDAFGRLLRDASVDLALHGHDHREHEMSLPWSAGGGATAVVGCGSSSISPHPGGTHAGRFNVYDVGPGRLEVERWELRPGTHRFARRAG